MGADGGFGQLADMGTNWGFAEEVTAEEVVLLLLFSFTKTNKKIKEACRRREGRIAGRKRQYRKVDVWEKRLVKISES